MLFSCGWREGALDDKICPGNFLGQRHLAVDAPQGRGPGKAIALFEPGDLGFPVGSDDDNLVHPRIDSGFEEEGNVVDHHNLRIFSGGLPGQPGLFAGDTGVDDALQPAQPGPVAEHDGAQRLAIEGAIGVEDGLAERLEDLSPGWFARLHDVVSQLVGIDDDRAALLEHSGDRTFARGDSAGESYENHDAELSTQGGAPQETRLTGRLARL